MPDKVSFFYAQISKKWLELSLKKFSSYIFKNNGESETVLYLTNGRKKRLVRTNLLCEEGATLCDERIWRLRPRILDQEDLTKQTIHFVLYRFEEVFLPIVEKDF